jgi:hypothetical protein
MSFDWILNPIAQYALVGLGLVGCLYLWISAKMEMNSVRRAVTNSRQTVDAGLQNLFASLEEVKASAATPKAEPEPLPTPAGLLSLNLTKRAQALRMYRRGETPSSIAAALQTPSNEIELLLKLDHLLESHSK